mgnify:CR=1 FL=1
MPKNQKECMSVREVARRLGCGDALVQAGLISKQLPFGQAIKLPSGRRRYIISRVAFERWLEDPTGEIRAAR